ncbi:hypothetical protein HK096_005572 [Nowakowskiella sp. JEL0078]|nr:hypothetical protein HK096_005572 [Nowakowskiella sp. JEL0078]
MKFSVFLPPAASTKKVPVLFFLSGLTCNEDNFITKAGALKKASECNIAIICPDTSPRGLNIENEFDSWDFGLAAGFYVDATTEKWSGYKMYSYITEELIQVVQDSDLAVDLNHKSVFGHSMGGHGALTIALKNPGMFKSVSAFSPIANPINSPWGIKAFSGYLGDDKKKWAKYDATELVIEYNGPKLDILIDQGSEDQFLKTQLLPEMFVSSAKSTNKIELQYRLQEGYDHSYWFIQTFIDDHIEFHASRI